MPVEVAKVPEGSGKVRSRLQTQVPDGSEKSRQLAIEKTHAYDTTT